MIYYRHHSTKPPGSALVIVLVCLVLLAILTVAFFASVTVERQAAFSYASNSTAKLLADSAVDLVIGQIRDATHGVDGAGGTLAWACQPGMIRTYNESGQPEAYYKLYSWANMVGTGPFDLHKGGEMPPADWASSPAIYVDLNSPVAGSYPIVDPSAEGVVKGFKIENAPVSAQNNAPMPVQWLYVLQNGQIVAAEGTGSVAIVKQASAGNPIIGRIAFWTDDETSKININTAAGDVWASNAPGQPGNPGSFWDTPRMMSSFEKTYLAKFQPTKNEYQRFPGHPATTYLSAVFPALTRDQILQIVPKVAPGGSQGGTVAPTVGSEVVPDGDRLYSSVDELLFKTGTAANLRPLNSPLTPTDVEKARFFITAHSRAPEVNLFNQPRIVAWPISADIDKRTAFDKLIAKCGLLNDKPFFFQRSDANSPSKDLPAAADPSKSDVNRNRLLITYLRNLTDRFIPGFRVNRDDTFRKKYPEDRDQILTEIFDYVRSLNSQDTSESGISFTPVSTSLNGTAGQGQVVPIADDNHSDDNNQPLRGLGRFPTVREATLLFAGVGQTKGTQKSIPPNANQKPETPSGGVPIPDGQTRVQAVFFLSFFDPSQGYGAGVPNFQVRVSGLNSFTWNGQPMGFTGGTVTLNRNFNTGLYGGYKGASSFIHGTGFTAACTSGVIDLQTASSTGFAFTGGPVKVEILDPVGTRVLQTLTIDFPSATFPVPDLAPMLRDPGTGLNPWNTDYRNLAAPVQLNSAISIQPRFAGSGANTGGTTSTKMWACSKDVIRSVVLNTDPRLVAALQTVPSSYFSPIYGYDNVAERQVHAIAEALNGGGLYPFVGTRFGKFVAGVDYGTPEADGPPAPISPAKADLTYTGVEADKLQPTAGWVGGNPQGLVGYPAPIGFGMRGANCVPVNGVAAGTNQTDNASLANMPPGDWDNGFSIVADGGYINKADEGSITGLQSGSLAYYEGLSSFTSGGGTFFSPNRQMPSAVMFGSLPTGVHANRPWQTLLFRPDPGGSPQHIGATSPKDHLLLDLFTMPVVEPYAISEPFSTAGKINLNTEIVPFNYIKRDTGLRAVLRSEQILAIPNSDGPNYKKLGAVNDNRRRLLDLDQTLVGVTERFDTGDIFRSATEICDIWLVPQGESYNMMQSFWGNNQLTGDNVRERPYANIYPRLTTKSNTFTVHYRVQTLKKNPGTPATQWDESRDTISGEYRGSSMIERFLDPNDKRLPDYATERAPEPIDNFYKFRVLETRRFNP